MTCPLCHTALVAMDGDAMHPNDPKHGVTVWCPAPYFQVCPAQEVVGHGVNLKEAYNVVVAKYTPKTKVK